MNSIEKILKTGNLSGFKGSPEGHSGGVFVLKLEESFRSYFGVKHALTLNSATAALHASLIAGGIGRGDEVIVTPYTFSSSASCVLMVGAKPIFVDIQDDIFCIDPDRIEEKITPRTKAIIPVHLCGHSAEMNKILPLAKKYNLFVIEDSAQAIGAIYNNRYTGTMGDCGVFSFNQSKHINTGEGGLLITNDDLIARRVKAVRNHGEVSDPDLKLVGYNYRLCEIEASLALEQLYNLDSRTDIRIELAGRMSEKLGQIPGFTPPVTYPDCKHVFYTFAVKYDADLVGMPRDEFQDKMIQRGIYFGRGYVTPLYLLPIYKKFGYKEGMCPVTERMWKKELLVFDWMKYPKTKRDVDKAVKIVKEVISAR